MDYKKNILLSFILLVINIFYISNYYHQFELNRTTIGLTFLLVFTIISFLLNYRSIKRQKELKKQTLIRSKILLCMFLLVIIPYFLFFKNDTLGRGYVLIFTVFFFIILLCGYVLVSTIKNLYHKNYGVIMIDFIMVQFVYYLLLSIGYFSF